MLTICILSWKSHKTLLSTLNSYVKGNLFKYADETLIFFQEISSEDIEIAKQFKLNYLGAKSNIGIEGAWKEILNHAKNPNILILEADCPLIEPEAEVKTQLKQSIDLLTNNKADIVRLRHRFETGYKFNILDKYKKLFADNWSRRILRFLRPNKTLKILGAAIYAHNDPERIHPQYIEKYNDNTYITSSKHLNWTNQSIMFRKDFVLNTILPYVEKHPSSRTLNGFQDLEKSLNCKWWRKQNFKIAVGLGLFTHIRWDRD